MRLVLGLVLGIMVVGGAAAEVDFNSDIRPILSDKCYFCHGPDAADIKGKLQLHTFDAATSDRDGRGAAIVPGDLTKSLLWERVTSTDPDEVMPPPKRHMKVTKAEQEKLKEWILSGAKYDELWSFARLPQQIEVPAVQSELVRNDVDRFVQVKLTAKKMQPAAEADRATLLRRVHLVLTGLVPTPAEIAAFEADASPDAYEKVVDKLLSSQASAEHLAVDWMDLSRYADSYGYQRDNGRDTWPWRDWVLRAFQENMPYDQFITQQLAGDLLPKSDDQMKLATAFNRLHGMKVEGGSVEEEFRTEYVFDRVQTVGTAFMGLTMECTRCHDHKYDPISMEDYFGMFALFNNIDESGLLAYFNTSVPSPTMILASDAEKAELSKRAAAVKAAEQALSKTKVSEAAAFAEWRQTWDGDVAIQGKVAHYSFDGVTGGHATNDYYMPEVSDAGGGMIATKGKLFVLKHPDFAGKPVQKLEIKLSGKKRILSIAELEIWAGGKNLVKDAKLAQSSEYNAGSFPVELLRDGNTENFTHTAESTNPWLRIELAESAVLDEIKIWNRTEVPERLHDAQVVASGADGVVAEMRLKLPGGEKAPTVKIAGKVVEGMRGKGLWFDGDTTMNLGTLGPFARHDDFSFSIGIKPSAHHERAVILHRSKAWTDAGSRGYELVMHHGKLDFALIHFSPGNELRVRTLAKVPVDTWTRVTMTYDGSGKAAGIKLYLDGELAATEIVKDHLTKEIWYSHKKNMQVQLAARMRDNGWKDSGMDEVAFFDRELSALEVREQHVHGAKPKGDDELREYFLTGHSLPVRQALEALAAARRAHAEYLDGRRRMMVMKELPKRRPTYVLSRGLYSEPDPKRPVEAVAPEVIFPFGEEYPRNRLGLAQWLTHPEHPLTARVTVNRYWQNVFGMGIVKTANDFGFQGAPPTHPGLLNYLARYFVDSGWDVRALLKLMVTSHTFRQSSLGSPEAFAGDPENALLARGPSYHLTAEMLRDSAIHAGGTLDQRLGGGSVNANSNRRTLYVQLKRNDPTPELLTFGAPRRQVCEITREETTTPLQALTLLNSPMFVRSSQQLAAAVTKQNIPDDARLSQIFLRLTSREPAAAELEVLQQMLEEQRAYFQSSPEVVKQYLKVNAAKAGGVSAPELAAWSAVASAVMNLDSFYMLR